MEASSYLLGRESRMQRGICEEFEALKGVKGVF